MKGKVLGLASADAHGVINGEDGKRYRYAAADWRGDAAPSVGSDVDFDAGADGAAQDIYPALGGRGIPNLSLDGANLPPAAGNALAIAKGSPIIWTAAVALLASVLLTFVSIAANIPGLSGGEGSGLIARNITGDASVLGLAGKVSAFNDLVGFVEQSAAAAGEYIDEESVGVVTQLKGFGGLLNLLYLVYLTPVLAAAVLYLEFTRKPNRTVNLAFAASCVLSVALIWFVQMQLDNAIEGLMESVSMGAGGAALVSGSDLFKFGLGAWVILLAGLAAVAVNFNLIKLGASSSAAQIRAAE